MPYQVSNLTRRERHALETLRANFNHHHSYRATLAMRKARELEELALEREYRDLKYITGGEGTRWIGSSFQQYYS